MQQEEQQQQPPMVIHVPYVQYLPVTVDNVYKDGLIQSLSNIKHKKSLLIRHLISQNKRAEREVYELKQVNYSLSEECQTSQETIMFLVEHNNTLQQRVSAQDEYIIKMQEVLKTIPQQHQQSVTTMPQQCPPQPPPRPAYKNLVSRAVQVKQQTVTRNHYTQYNIITLREKASQSTGTFMEYSVGEADRLEHTMRQLEHTVNKVLNTIGSSSHRVHDMAFSLHKAQQSSTDLRKRNQELVTAIESRPAAQPFTQSVEAMEAALEIEELKMQLECKSSDMMRHEETLRVQFDKEMKAMKDLYEYEIETLQQGHEQEIETLQKRHQDRMRVFEQDAKERQQMTETAATKYRTRVKELKAENEVLQTTMTTFIKGKAKGDKEEMKRLTDMLMNYTALICADMSSTAPFLTKDNHAKGFPVGLTSDKEVMQTLISVEQTVQKLEKSDAKLIVHMCSIQIMPAYHGLILELMSQRRKLHHHINTVQQHDMDKVSYFLETVKEDPFSL